MNKKLLLLSVLLLTAVVGCKNKFNNSASQGSNSDSTEQVSTDEAAEGTSQAQIRQVDPALSGSDALEAIKKNYKGKVAFFDFWATWCPPCRAAMREVDQIKPELQKQGAVFVYITGETSPEEECDGDPRRPLPTDRQAVARNQQQSAHSRHSRLLPSGS